jgi:hypothetical protein
MIFDSNSYTPKTRPPAKGIYMETPSTMLPLNTVASSFSLPDTSGRIWSLDDFRNAPALLIVFMCNHCPYVKHVRETMVRIISEYQGKGLATVEQKPSRGCNKKWKPGNEPLYFIVV